MTVHSHVRNSAAKVTSVLQWQLVTEVDVDIGANPSAEGGDEEEGGGGGDGRRVVDLVDSFRLTVSAIHSLCLQCFTSLLSSGRPMLTYIRGCRSSHRMTRRLSQRI